MPPTSGIERAVFPGLDRAGIDAWLDRHLQTRLGAGAAQVLLRSGRVAAVFGVLLDDGRRVAVKVHRHPADTVYLTAAAACQASLAATGFPCPRPLDGPSVTEGRTAVVETLLDDGEPGDGRDPVVRRAMAFALHDQLQALRGYPTDGLLAGSPAWARYQQGPWPTPHDPIFDFSVLPQQYGWLDDLAARAAARLLRVEGRPVVGHSDWVCGNLRFARGQVAAAYDWDSLAVATEPVLVGISAGAFTEGADGQDAPSPDEVQAFLRDYDQARREPFDRAQQQATSAAVTWVTAYNARCELTFVPPGGTPQPGSPLAVLAAHREAYLELSW